jgi:hypothetical protein
MPQVPFTDIDRLVAFSLEHMRDRSLIVEETVLIAHNTIDVRVPPRDQLTPVGCANWTRRESLIKNNAFPSQPIEIRCSNDWITIAGQPAVAQLVGEDI